jgi:hypothetical protein
MKGRVASGPCDQSRLRTRGEMLPLISPSQVARGMSAPCACLQLRRHEQHHPATELPARPGRSTWHRFLPGDPLGAPGSKVLSGKGRQRIDVSASSRCRWYVDVGEVSLPILRRFGF